MNNFKLSNNFFTAACVWMENCEVIKCRTLSR